MQNDTAKMMSDSVMVNFILQLGWATVPKYLVKHYSGYFFEDAI